MTDQKFERSIVSFNTCFHKSCKSIMFHALMYTAKVGDMAYAKDKCQIKIFENLMIDFIGSKVGDIYSNKKLRILHSGVKVSMCACILIMMRKQGNAKKKPCKAQVRLI